MRTPLSSVRGTGLSGRRRLLVLLLGVLLFAAILTLDLSLVEHMERVRGGDFFQFWAAGRTILRRADPYDPEAWRTIYEAEGHWRWQTDQQVFVYPLWTAFPFVPLALLPVSGAFLVWTLMSEALLFVSVVACIGALSWPDRGAWLLLMLSSAVAFEPVSLTILFGQLGIALLGLLAGTLFLLSRGHYPQAGALLALTLIKPQLFLLVYPALILIMIVQRRWSFVVAFAATVAALLFSSWSLVPNWVAEWQEYVAPSTAVRLSISPTVWGASHSVSVAVQRQDLWLVIGLAASVVVAAILVYERCGRRLALPNSPALEPEFSLTIIASLLIAPYVLSYDFVLLLLPIVTCLWVAHKLAGSLRWVLAISVVGCGIILPWALLIPSVRTGKETIAVIIPCSILAILLVSTFALSRTTDRRTPPNQRRNWHPDETAGGTACPL